MHNRKLAALILVLFAMHCGDHADASILPAGVPCDSQGSIAYDPNTGELVIDAPLDFKLNDVSISSASGIFDPDNVRNVGPEFGGTFFDVVSSVEIFKATFARPPFGSLSFGFAAPVGLKEEFLLSDLTVIGTPKLDRTLEESLADPATLGDVDLIYGPVSDILDCGTPESLHAGDADQDHDFDQLDLVQVQVAAKFLTGEPATWGEGDWDGAPGGSRGNPPAGDGLFNQADIVEALQANVYLTGPYAAVTPGGNASDGPTSLVDDAQSGEPRLTAPASTNLTPIHIASADSSLVGEQPATFGDAFENLAADNLFTATFDGGFETLSLGNVVPMALSEVESAADLTVEGSLEGGGVLGSVDFIYIPEPSTVLLAAFGIMTWMFRTRRDCNRKISCR